MIALGYMAKRIVIRPNWLDAPSVRDIYAVSNCIARDFCNYVDYWKHNGFWFFNSPDDVHAIAAAEKIDLSETEMLYYAGYEKQYDADAKKWSPYGPDPDFATCVVKPTNAEFLGFDIVTYSMQNMPECSPLSCNLVASEVDVNSHGLLNSLDEAVGLLELGTFDDCEPGPYRIISISRLDAWEDACPSIPPR